MKKHKWLVVVVMLGSLFIFATTLIDLAHQVKGVLPVVNGGSGVGVSTGTVAAVLSTSPTLVTPLLGTPTSGVLTNTTGYPWSSVVNPVGSLALSNGTNTSIFSGTAATSQFFAWKNTTAAVVGTSQGSPVNALCGTAFHGSASVEDCLTLGELPGNGNDAAIAFTLGHTGTSTGAVTLGLPGGITMNGSTSGSVSITPPAVAGTATNAIVISNAVQLASGNPLQWNGDTGISRPGVAGTLAFGAGTAGSSNARLEAGAYLIAGTKFATNAGCGESAGTTTGGATAGKFTTAGSTSCTSIITMGSAIAAINGWSCWVHDATTSADYNNPHISSTSTTQVTIVSGTIVAADVLEWGCVGY